MGESVDGLLAPSGVGVVYGRRGDEPVVDLTRVEQDIQVRSPLGEKGIG